MSGCLSDQGGKIVLKRSRNQTRYSTNSRRIGLRCGNRVPISYTIWIVEIVRPRGNLVRLRLMKILISFTGKKAHSMTPRKSRVRSAPVKLWVTPVKQEMTPQTIIHPGRYKEGFPMKFRKRFDGTYEWYCLRTRCDEHYFFGLPA